MKEKYNFIYKQPRKFNILIFTYVTIFILTISYIFSSKTYSKKNLKGVVNRNQIVISTNVLNMKLILKSKFIRIDNKKYNMNILEISEVYNDGNNNIQDIVIKFDNQKYVNNQIIEVTFYYEYDYMFKKLLRGVLE